jgi:hypothetical protein
MALVRETPSSVAASLMSMLWRAPTPVPTATGVGMARPSVSGQAITTAEIAKVSANRAGAPAMKSQTMKQSAFHRVGALRAMDIFEGEDELLFGG